MNPEQERLAQCRAGSHAWRQWGPYLSERQWGTVREDYSENGDAWNYFPHDHARLRAYRWGEDGLAGVSDDHQRLCFALALWNRRDPILKERLFGLTNSEGNHGEDVKEYYFYLDNTPTHSWMRQLYKYPQAAFPYDQLAAENRQRGRDAMEYELLDTGVFNQGRYFDIVIDYAKASASDLLIRVTVHNRGPDAAALDVLPTLWFRNTWSWGDAAPKPALRRGPDASGAAVVEAVHADLGQYRLLCEGTPPLLFTENETNQQRLSGAPNPTAHVKDGFHDYVVGGVKQAVDPAQTGTKAAAWYSLEIPAGESRVIRLRLAPMDAAPAGFDEFEAICEKRSAEADEFYRQLAPGPCSEDELRVFRQALAGMLWGKQFYYYDLDKWLEERGNDPFRPDSRLPCRNQRWFHMVNADVISMPDKWEYPWYAAWDLAFHCWPLALVDADFAKDQLDLMLRERYLHPNGQIPAYEWNFGDVNPPVHAWATLMVYEFDRRQTGQGDIGFLKQAFQKLLLNFTWWVNRKDPSDRNVFEGGFLGLDNIGVFDRSAPLPTGGCLEQADGTAWVALYCQNMLQIALELATHDPTYEDVSLKFFEHFLWIASAMDRLGDNHDEMWDEADGFFYDVLRLPDGSATRLKVRSLVGLLPLCATTVFPAELLARLPNLGQRIRWFLEKRPELVANIHPPLSPGQGGRHMLAILGEEKLRRVLARLLAPDEFLSPHGVRSLSRYHEAHPYRFGVSGQDYVVSYLPAESDSGMFGGNSNWRGPVWIPVNALIIRALLNYYAFFGDAFKVEFPTGSGDLFTLFEVAEQLSRRLVALFFAECRWTTARPRRRQDTADGSALAGSHSVLRVFPRRQRSRPRRQPSNGMDGCRCGPHTFLWQRRCRVRTRWRLALSAIQGHGTVLNQTRSAGGSGSIRLAACGPLAAPEPLPCA